MRRRAGDWRQRPPLMLCHAVATVLLDRKDRWVLPLDHTCIKANANVATTTRTTLTQEEAADMLRQVARSSQMVCSALGKLRHAPA